MFWFLLSSYYIAVCVFISRQLHIIILITDRYGLREHQFAAAVNKHLSRDQTPLVYVTFRHIIARSRLHSITRDIILRATFTW
jgi:hypothetical protein